MKLYCIDDDVIEEYLKSIEKDIKDTLISDGIKETSENNSAEKQAAKQEVNAVITAVREKIESSKDQI